MRQYRALTERLRRREADRFRRPQADGTAIAAAVARIRDEEAAALVQLRGPQPQ